MTHRVRVILAFAAIYLIWGSTYLAIRFAIDTLPPFLMAGVRFVIAGALLYGWARWRGATRPSRGHWLAAVIVGGLMLLGGNGGVVWAEQRVPSGLTSVLIATVPLWVAVLDWLRRGTRPSSRMAAGLALGLAGIVLLVGPAELAGTQRMDLLGAGCSSWRPCRGLQAPFTHAAPAFLPRRSWRRPWRCWPAACCCCWPAWSPARRPIWI